MNKLSPLSSQPTDVQAEVEQLQQQVRTKRTNAEKDEFVQDGRDFYDE